MKPGRQWCAVTLALAVVGLVQPAAQQRSPISTAGKAALSRFLSTAVDRGDVPGVVALIVTPEGVVYEGRAGRQDVARRVEMAPDTLFRIASMTKPITSVAIMMLIEAGKLNLDDPVSKYRPEFKDRAVITSFNAASGAYQTRPATRAITIRHLMAHTSGLGYSWSSPVVSRLTQNVREREPEIPLLHDPGERWTYGASTRVLGQVVETMSGQALDAFLRDRIFTPLGMADTSFTVPTGNLSRVATLHSRASGTLVEEPNAPVQQAPVRGDGGLYSTARDYGVFMQMLLNGGSLRGTTILRPASVRMMGENQLGSIVVQEQPVADPSRSRPFPLGAGRDTFGLGFQIAARDERYAKLRSPGSLSWAGINNTHFWIDPNRRVAVVLLMQVLPFYDEAAIRTLRGFEELVYQQLN